MRDSLFVPFSYFFLSLLSFSVKNTFIIINGEIKFYRAQDVFDVLQAKIEYFLRKNWWYELGSPHSVLVHCEQWNIIIKSNINNAISMLNMHDLIIVYRFWRRYYSFVFFFFFFFFIFLFVFRIEKKVQTHFRDHWTNNDMTRVFDGSLTHLRCDYVLDLMDGDDDPSSSLVYNIQLESICCYYFTKINLVLQWSIKWNNSISLEIR